MFCGRSVHLAMELKTPAMTEILLDCGADISLGIGFPVDSYVCETLSRPMWCRVILGLRAAVAGREAAKAAT
jgi:hypothetical protein